MKSLVIALIVGGLASAGPTFYFTRAAYQRDLLALQAGLDKARADLVTANGKLNDVLLEERNAEQARLDGIAGNLDALSRGMSTCARKSDVRITTTPERVIETVRDGELRDLADVIRDFANACAVGRDRDAIDHNKLIDWFKRLPSELEATQK